VAAQIKGQKVKKSYAWGSAELFTGSAGITYLLEMVPTGGRLTAVPLGTTKVTVKDITDRFSPRGFHCKIEPTMQSLSCKHKEVKASYTVFGYDPCLGHEAKFDEICVGKGVYHVSISVGFAPASRRTHTHRS
jgi:hypothetical protein